MNRTRRVIVAGVLGIISICLLGCMSTEEQMLRAGYNPAYAIGYAHGEGCGLHAAGHPYAHFIKDTYRYDRDPQYRQGWDDGFACGKGRYDAINMSWRR